MTTPAPATALITGGTSGIGLATAQLLHERGYRVMVTGRTFDQVPDEIVAIPADSRSLADTDRVADEVRERFGELTLLFLNAGLSRPAPVETADETTYDELFDTNTKGAFFTLQKTLPFLVDGASVIFTVGVGAIRGITGGSVTAASRGALLTMVPSLAKELAPRRIRVNAVSPGAIRTPIWSREATSPEALAQTLDAVTERIPFGRLGEAGEIAELVAFLASDAGSYITGQNIVVGGGVDV